MRNPYDNIGGINRWLDWELKHNNMYKYKKANKTSLEVNQSKEGETLEKKIERVVNNKEPITDGAPIIYTERKDGVQPQYDIRTDRFEIAVEAMDKVQKTHQARREERHMKPLKEDENPKNGTTDEGKA